MLIDSEMIKQTKEQIEVMQAFIDGKEIELKERFKKNDKYKKANTPNWDFLNFEYRIKPSEPVDAVNDLSTHTSSTYEDYQVSTSNDDLNINEPIVELYEVMKETNGRFFIKSKLYEFKEIVNYNSAYKITGRSFIINKDTKEIIKIKNKKRL